MTPLSYDFGGFHDIVQSVAHSLHTAWSLWKRRITERIRRACDGEKEIIIIILSNKIFINFFFFFLKRKKPYFSTTVSNVHIRNGLEIIFNLARVDVIVQSSKYIYFLVSGVFEFCVHEHAQILQTKHKTNSKCIYIYSEFIIFEYTSTGAYIVFFFLSETIDFRTYFSNKLLFLARVLVKLSLGFK